MLQKRSLYWRENGDTEVVSWTENGQFNGGKMVLFNGGGMVMLQGWSLEWREKGHVRGSEVVSLMEGE